MVENWGALIGIMDSHVVAYDAYSSNPLGQITDSKGTVLISIHEHSNKLSTIPSPALDQCDSSLC